MKPILHYFKVMAYLRRIHGGILKSQEASNYFKTFPATPVKEMIWIGRSWWKWKERTWFKEKDLRTTCWGPQTTRINYCITRRNACGRRKTQFLQQLGRQRTLRGLTSYSNVSLPRYVLEIQDFPQTSWIGISELGAWVLMSSGRFCHTLKFKNHKSNPYNGHQQLHPT